MIPVAIAAATAAASIYNSLKKGDDKNIKRATREIGAIKPPTLAELLVDLERAVSAGKITPEKAKQYLVEASKLEGFKEDPALREAQTAALSEMGGIVDAGGLDAQALAQINELQDRVATQSRGDREAIMADAR